MPGTSQLDLVHTTDFLTEVAKGYVNGHALVSVFGLNNDLDNGVSETLWSGGGQYVFPVAAGPVSVVSTSVNDAAAGIGARTIILRGLDANYYAISETLTLTGTTPVVSAKSYLRFTFAQVVTSGNSNNALNAGTITGSIGGSVFVMLPGTNAAPSGVYTVPDKNTAYLLQMTVNAVGGSAGAYLQSQLMVKFPGQALRVRDNYYCGGGAVPTQINYAAPFKMFARADVFVNATASANNMIGLCRFDLLQIEDH